MDGGTKLLLSTFHKADGLKGKVLDLGCGAGVIGASLKKQFPKIKLTMSDIHAMAIASSKRTLAENALEGEVLASDVFSHIEGRFDLIVSNPPFHDGVDTAYQAVENLILQAKKPFNQRRGITHCSECLFALSRLARQSVRQARSGGEID